MNTPIVKISDDQNEITHESGVVTVFVESVSQCEKCCYYKNFNCSDIPCHFRTEFTPRKEFNYGIFKLKQQTT